MRNLIGRTLGHYRIVEKIGEGGMGEVYRAHDERLDRDVAVKVLPELVAQDADRLARFEREAKAVAHLDHPNILAIHDFRTEDGVAYAVMELLEGEALRMGATFRIDALRQWVTWHLPASASKTRGHPKGNCRPRTTGPESGFGQRYPKSSLSSLSSKSRSMFAGA